MKKKNYNPFKMWGSWLGVTIALLFSLIISMMAYFTGHTDFQNGIYVMFMLPSIVLYMLGDIPTIIYVCISSISWIIFGFLIGWLIHSIVRAFK